MRTELLSWESLRDYLFLRNSTIIRYFIATVYLGPNNVPRPADCGGIGAVPFTHQPRIPFSDGEHHGPVIEYYAEITDKLIGVNADPDRSNHVLLTTEVSSAANVDDWPNLFAMDVGSTIAVSARKDSAAVTAGNPKARLQVRTTGPGAKLGGLAIRAAVSADT